LDEIFFAGNPCLLLPALACPYEQLQIIDGNEGGMGGRHGRSGQGLKRWVRLAKKFSREGAKAREGGA
jgi:hypothetical protein